MQNQALNARAEKKYGEFVGAIDFVTETLIPLEKLIARMHVRNTPPGGWRIPKPDELKQNLAMARKNLEALKAHAIKYEIELKSKEWRI
jgi:hypothetical protein